MTAAVALTLLAGLFGWLGWRSHRALRAHEARFRVLVEGSSDLITVVSPELLITDQSDSLTHILGYPPKSRHRRPLGELVHPADRPALLGLVRDGGLPPGGAAQVTVRARHADASWRWLEITVRNLVADRRVRGYVLNCRDVSETRQLHDAIERLASSDPLTGLANRRAFEVVLARVLDGGGTAPVSVLLCDLADFTFGGDGFGGDIGDGVLQQVAVRLRRAIKEGDLLARLGGGRFAVLAVGCDPDGGDALASRLLGAVRPLVEAGGHQVLVQASVGVATAQPAATAGGLLRDVEAAAAAARRDSVRGWRRFDPSLREEAERRQTLAIDLRTAVQEAQFCCVYQPIIDLAGGQLLSLEALVRWRHPASGLVAPGGFIDYAEESGLIHELGRWVLYRACEQAQEWSAATAAPVPVSVNVSPRQLHRPEYVTEVMRALAETGLPPAQLTLEITESAVLGDIERTITDLGQLRSLGVRVALDDFGTGYSSLAYLRRLPLDHVKIDRTFVGTLRGSEDSAVVRAVVKLGRTFGFTAIAEGVEHASQVGDLLALGCPYGQGFGLTRPLTPAQVPDYLAERTTVIGVCSG